MKLAGYYKCRQMILDQINQLNRLAEEGEIDIYNQDKTALFDHCDKQIIGNLLNSPVWSNTLLCWFYRQAGYNPDYYNNLYYTWEVA